MASRNFTTYTRALLSAQVNMTTATVKTMLVSSVPTESNFDTWAFRSDVTNEISGTGYTTGGISQPFTLDALDTAGNRQTVTYTNIPSAWTSSSFSAVGSIQYIDTGSSATSRVIGFSDFGGTQTVSSGSFDLTYTSSAAVTAV